MSATCATSSRSSTKWPAPLPQKSACSSHRRRKRGWWPRAVNPAAHDAYLLGRYYTAKLTPESLKKAVESLNEAIKIDPQSAPAYAALSRAHAERDVWGGLGIGTSAKDVHEAAVKAVELDPNLAEAHFALAAARSDY